MNSYNTRNKLTALFTAFAVCGAAYTHAQEAKPVAGVFRLNALYTDGGYSFVGTAPHSAYSIKNGGTSWELAPELEAGVIVNGKHEFTLSADRAKFTNHVVTSFEAFDEDFTQTNVLAHYRYRWSNASGKVTTFLGAAVGWNQDKVGGSAFDDSETSLTYGADCGLAYNFAKGWSANVGLRYMLRKQADFGGQLGDDSATGGGNSAFPTFDKIGTVGALSFTAGLSFQF